MKTLLTLSLVLATFVCAAVEAHARDVYGVRGPRRGAIVGENRAVVRTPRGIAATGPRGTAVARRPLPRGYIRTLPAGYRRFFYGGYNCYFVGGVYYRAVIYGGETTYVIVN